MSIPNDTTSTITHSIITGSGSTVLTSNDHTTQIIAIVSQILALIFLFVRNNSNQTKIK